MIQHRSEDRRIREAEIRLAGGALCPTCGQTVKVHEYAGDGQIGRVMGTLIFSYHEQRPKRGRNCRNSRHPVII
jgi:hypothetical protein